MIPVLRVSIHIYGVSQEIDWKTFIFQVNLGMWPLKSLISEKRALFWGFQHTFMGFPWRIDGKMFIFQVNLGMWPSNRLSQKNNPCSESFNTHLWGFLGDRWENVHFSTKPRHVTPQIEHLRKMSPVMMVSTHIYRISKEIDGKSFIFQVNLGLWPLKSNISEKQALFWGFQHTFMGFPWR